MKPTQLTGFAILAVGLIWLMIAFNMDTSVATGGGEFGISGRVENIGLIAQRQNHIIVSCFVSLAGVLLILFGGARVNSALVTEQQNAPELGEAPERNLTADSYRLWLTQHYKIQHNEILSRFIIGQKTFETLDDALSSAHSLELEQLEQARIAGEKAAEDERVRAEAERIRGEKSDKFAKVIGIALIIVFVASLPALYFLSKHQEEARIAATNAALQSMGIVKSADMTDLQGKDVTADSDDKTWCDGAAGTLVTFGSTSKPDQIISYVTKGATTENPYSNDDNLIARKFRNADGKLFLLTIFPDKRDTRVYLCRPSQ